MAIIGIDLGTTNSLVAYFTESGPMLIPNSFGENLTPSVVSMGSDDEIFVGKTAKERLITFPDDTISSFKRQMGTKKEIVLKGRAFLPEELSSFVIKKLKEDAENYLGEKVEEAIISVPAYFNDAQRRATKNAGELAGLKVERIVNEPTAAAVAYGMHEKADATKYLIFDLGGGTFDISILELYKNIMEVRAVAGDNFLGGDDFNDVLINMFLERNEIDEGSLSKRERAIIRKASETTKRAFYSDKKVKMSCNLEDNPYEMEITLEDYEKSCAMLLAKLKRPIVRALSDASIKLNDIDTIVLVGGATKLPIVRNFVSKLFGRLPASSINPDEVVALGAAVQAAMKERNQSIKEIVLTDVCPFTLGTNISLQRPNGIYQTGNFFPIIERNTVIPVSRVERLYTVHDNQTTIRVEILQGENRKSKDNIFLGELSIPVPPAPGGNEAVDVRYTYDINGILEVEVTAITTGTTKKIVIEKNPGSMSKDEIAERLNELKALKIHPREKDEYSYLLSRGERLYEETVGDLRKYIGDQINYFEGVLDKQNESEIRKAAEDFKTALSQAEENMDF